MLKNAWFYRIKAAQRDLIALSGGIERAAEITSISKSHVGRWNNAQDTDLMPLNAVLMLEEHCGVAVVTSVMAELNGRRLADETEATRQNADVLSAYAEAVRHAGEVMSAGAIALADGKVTPAEALTVDRAVSVLERGLSDLRQTLAHVRAGDLKIVGGEGK
ncbi:phage regulatory CII family protein [Hoeflea alexandrii]|jgi:hypothetical protein|uniref:HTH cro/C1-type domain-containing protein n=1 Tax=Hoeflea alexandrii TaxID=288436 RepID=A0ABT1CV42_9HYPH|nr:phage regulatory CII family protein [Hoeflea alexandrii]MCO6410074.1 hypothetical protein [Hoeflea alexandrii]MCY0153046.1 hypothetical protein [Hoeflea alexandrii]